MTAPSDRRSRRRDSTRRALLEASLVLFAERGLYATRIEDITERIDLGKGAFYNYFESKDALVAALVAEAVERLDRAYLSPMSPGVDPMPELARRHQQFFDEHPAYMLLFHQARGLLLLRPEGSAALRAAFRDYLTRIGRHCAGPSKDRADDSIGPDLDLASVIAGTLTGTRSYRLAAGLPDDGILAAELLVRGVPLLRRHADSSGPAER